MSSRNRLLQIGFCIEASSHGAHNSKWPQPNLSFDMSDPRPALRSHWPVSTSSRLELIMNIKKPTPVLTGGLNRTCPVCGKRSYSSNGIHPQCAVNQADEPSKRKYKAEKKLPSKKKSMPGRTGSFTWKKACPKCGVELHVRSKACGCGHRFER